MKMQKKPYFKIKTNIKYLLTIGFALTILSSCAEEIENRGYVTKFSDFEAIKVGQSKTEVSEKLGTPSLISKAGGETWIYAGSEVTKETFFEPKVKDYNAYKIVFNDSGEVSEIITKNQDNRKDIASAKETTETGGNSVTFIQQLLGNLGRYNPAAGGRVGGGR